jgi:ubiquinone biosynthesis protein UbiJ
MYRHGNWHSHGQAQPNERPADSEIAELAAAIDRLNERIDRLEQAEE